MSVGRYAQAEYERRFVLDAVPADAREPRWIVDRYLNGTRLRLRTVREDGATGKMLQRKVGQKVRPNPGDAATVLHTTMYLDRDELDALAHVDATVLAKTRYRWRLDGHPVAVDVYGASLCGLVVAEMCFEDRDLLDAYRPNPVLGPEITGIDALTGPNLASLSWSEVCRLLATAVD